MKLFAALLFLSCAGLAQQTGTPVTTTSYPHDSPTIFMDYDGSGNNIYNCYARPVVNYTPITGSSATMSFQWTFAGSTLTSIVDSSNTSTVTTPSAHGLQVGNLVVISGTSSSALNASYYVQTVPSTTTFTVTTSGVADATYTTGAVLSTRAPLLTQPIWSIEKITYNSSNKSVADQWALGAPGNFTNICANRATTTGATMITYQ